MRTDGHGLSLSYVASGMMADKWPPGLLTASSPSCDHFPLPPHLLPQARISLPQGAEEQALCEPSWTASLLLIIWILKSQGEIGHQMKLFLLVGIPQSSFRKPHSGTEASVGVNCRQSNWCPKYSVHLLQNYKIKHNKTKQPQTQMQ